MKNTALITPEMKSSPSVYAEAQAFRKSANLVLRPLASTRALLRGFNRRTSQNRRLGPNHRDGNRLVKLHTRLQAKYSVDNFHIFARLYKIVAKGICGRFGWKDFNRARHPRPRFASGIASGNRTVPKEPGRRDLIRASARSHQARKGLAS